MPQGRDVDWLVVGAGLSGATLAERLASRLGQRVLVVDQRDHIGGNTFDSLDDAGVLVHRYGAHIFHTSNEPVWDYLSRFTSWLPYEHRVLAQVDGRLVPVPFNLNTLDALLPAADAAALTRSLLARFGAQARVPVLALVQDADPALRDLGALVYEKIFLNYTVKQWGLRPEQLDRSVTGRVPVLVTRDDGYFADTHQGIPTDGYTAMVARMLDHPLIRVELSTTFAQVDDRVTRGGTVFTGPVDEYFDHAFGPLPYRSLRFEHSTEPVTRFQPVAVVNYPNEHAYTRILEHAHFRGDRLASTTITREHPQPHVPGETEPFYPIPTAANRALYQRYRAAADALPGQVVFAGRLAHYRYYDMDQAVAHALHAFARIAAGRPAAALVP